MRLPSNSQPTISVSQPASVNSTFFSSDEQCNSCSVSTKTKKGRWCHDCQHFFHLTCVKLSRAQSNALDIWVCFNCQFPQSLEAANDNSHANVNSAADLLRWFAETRKTHRVIQRVPKGARIAAAQALADAICSALSHDGETEWVRLSSFAKLALHQPDPKEDGSNLTSFATTIKRQIQASERGDNSARCKLTTAIRGMRTLSPTESLKKRVRAKLMDGDVRAALRVVASNNTIAPPSDDTLEELRSKHPAAPSHMIAPERPDVIATPDAIVITNEDIKTAIRSFPASSSAGLDGLRPGHLRDLTAKCTAEAGQNLIKALVRLMQRFIDGDLPNHAREIMYSANLCALRKKCGGIRPIAMGNVFRRMAAKIAVKRISTRISDELQPTQLGFGVRGGCEAAVHALRRHLTQDHTSNPEVLVKLDMRNAFNSVHRDHMLRVVKERIPSVYPMAWQAYATPSSIFYECDIIESACGLQQGDPLGPVIFALSVDKIANSINSPINIWYLDDATLSGPIDQVMTDIRRLIPALGRIGLEVNPGKSEICCLGYSPKCAQDATTLFSSVLPGARIINPEYLSILGAPLGQLATLEVLESKKVKLDELSQRLQDIDAHPAFFLLKNCLAMPKLVYTLRTTPCYKFPDSVHELDIILRRCAEIICNVDFNDTGWTQATLPVRFGGLGLRKPSDVALPAFTSSLIGSLQLSGRILLNTNSGSLADSELGHIGEEWSKVDGTLDIANAPQEQRFWDSISCKITHESILQGCRPVEKARILAATQPHTGAWLQAVPIPSLGTYLDDESLRIGISLRVGAQICVEHPCRCGALVDRLALHPLSCGRSAGRFPRHAALNDVIKRTLDRASIPSVLEPTGLDRGDGKRPDGMTIYPFKRGKALVWDATCTDTFGKSNLTAAALAAGSGAEKAEKAKREKYSGLNGRYIFAPLAFETTGVIGPETAKTLAEIGRRVAETMDDNREPGWLYQRISLAILRGNVQAIQWAGKLSY